MFDIYVKNVKSLHHGLKSYGFGTNQSYAFANKWVGQNAFGWDMSMGTASSTTTFEETCECASNAVRNEWENGWTGLGVTVGIVDNFKKKLNSNKKKTHGNLVSMVASNFAPEAEVRDIHWNNRPAQIADIDIINMSYGQGSKYKKQTGKLHYPTQYYLNKWSKTDSEKGTIFITSAGNASMDSHHDLSLIHISEPTRPY